MRKITMSYKMNASVKHAYMVMTSIQISPPMMKEHAQNVASLRNAFKMTPVPSNVISASTKRAMTVLKSYMGQTKKIVLDNRMCVSIAEAPAKIRD